jgi:hypothetical protein
MDMQHFISVPTYISPFLCPTRKLLPSLIAAEPFIFLSKLHLIPASQKNVIAAINLSRAKLYHPLIPSRGNGAVEGLSAISKACLKVFKQAVEIADKRHHCTTRHYKVALNKYITATYLRSHVLIQRQKYF